MSKNQVITTFYILVKLLWLVWDFVTMVFAMIHIKVNISMWVLPVIILRLIWRSLKEKVKRFALTVILNFIFYFKNKLNLELKNCAFEIIRETCVQYHRDTLTNKLFLIIAHEFPAEFSQIYNQIGISRNLSAPIVSYDNETINGFILKIVEIDFDMDYFYYTVGVFFSYFKLFWFNLVYLLRIIYTPHRL